MAEKRICPKCGRENDPENKFCVYCGADLVVNNFAGSSMTANSDKIKRTIDGQIICPKCGNPNDPDMNYCSVCGSNLKQNDIVEAVKCPHCGQINEKDSVFCTNCGKRIKVGPVESGSAIKCPLCGSTQIDFEVKQGNGYNVVLGVVCGILCFPIGFLAGLIGTNKNKKYIRHCRNCGHDF